jgi:hypothetical protein
VRVSSVRPGQKNAKTPNTTAAMPRSNTTHQFSASARSSAGAVGFCAIAISLHPVGLRSIFQVVGRKKWTVAFRVDKLAWYQCFGFAAPS